MKKTYTYNPEKIGEQGVDRMRFELGDTMVEGEQETSALCNEEYEAIIAARKEACQAGRAGKYNAPVRHGSEHDGRTVKVGNAEPRGILAEAVRTAEKRVRS